MTGSVVCTSCRLQHAIAYLRQERLHSALSLAKISSGTAVGSGAWFASKKTYSTQQQTERSGRVGRYSRQSLKPQEVLNELGSAPRNERQAGKATRRYNAAQVEMSPRAEASIQALYKSLKEQNITDVHRNLSSLLELFVSKECTATDREGIRRHLSSRIKDNALQNIIRAGTESLATSQPDDNPPSIVETLRVLQSFQVLDNLALQRALRSLARTIASSRIWRSGDGDVSSKAMYAFVPKEAEKSLLLNLLEVWRMYLETLFRRNQDNASIEASEGGSGVIQSTTFSDAEGAALQWAFLPNIETISMSAKKHQSLNALNMLELLFGQIQTRHGSLRETLLVTFDLFSTHEEDVAESVLSELETAAAPLKNFIRAISKLSGGFREISLDESNPADPFFSTYVKEMGVRLGIRDPSVSLDRFSKPRSEVFKHGERIPKDDVIKRTGRAVERADLALLEEIYGEYEKALPKDIGEPLFYSRSEGLILAFLTLRHPSRAVQVWNLMLKVGLSPTLRTWTNMLNGCQRANDTSALEGFWKMMRSEGFQPDHHAWSTRIMGLISGRRIEQGLAAMMEMGREWAYAAKAAKLAAMKARAAAHKTAGKRDRLPSVEQVQISANEFTEDIGGIPRPNVVIMNTAISALATRDDTHIHKALQWGQAFGIVPDMHTYNTLLNVTLRHGNIEEALDILKRMRESGHQLDNHTFTVILTALFESDEFLVGIGAQEQEQKVLDVVYGLESVSGATVDEKGYAVIIDRLLKRHNNAYACRGIFSHMQSQGIEPGVHFYTIMMAHYFASSPPQLDEIDSLWARIRSANGGHGIPLDNIFYDRMVEGYAKNHVTAGVTPMLRSLQVMSAEGKTPSWYVLRLVAEALAARGEWGYLEQIIGDVRHQDKGGNGGLKMKGMAGQRDFWEFIISTGLLDREGITKVSQVEIFRDDNFSAAAGKADIMADRAARMFR